jgi:hypothetical protein
VNTENFNTFVHYLNERESIRQKRERGEAGPWTTDPILSRYKFTNIMRSEDRTTRWLKKHWYDPNRDAPLDILALNCAIARYFGSIEFLSDVGFQTTWNPDLLIRRANERFAERKKVFTGAYIITNAGSTDPKQVVVVSQFLTPLRFKLDALVELATGKGRWQPVAEWLQKQPGIGAFMSKEIALDMMLTPLLENATDKLTWSPAGPGAIRGLNRLHDRPLQSSMSQDRALHEMQALLGQIGPHLADYMPTPGVDYGVTDIQFSLCELDKYLRVKNGEGRPRSGYDFRKAKELAV